MSDVRLRGPVEVALHHLAPGWATFGTRECVALLRTELLDLTAQLVESRMQVLTDRAELDGYRNLYGPLPERKPSSPTVRMSA